MKTIILVLFCMAVALTASAQKERKFIREGNGLFSNQDFEKAEVEYRKAMDKKAESFEAGFNLGDALYKQKKYDEALQQFSSLAKEETNKERLGQLYHNIGNTLFAMEKTDESIEAYKQSLRNRPTAEDTKYNLEFVRKKKQQDQENKDNKDKDQENKDQENKDQQDKDQNKKDQDKKDQDKKDQDKKNQQPQPQPGKISKEDAQRLLEALQGDEKKVQEKVQQQKVQEQKAKKMKIEKDW